MIFISLGTQDKSFVRLLKEVDKLIERKIIKENVIVQAGFTKYKSDNMKIVDYLNNEDFLEYIKSADYIITHGGVGNILTCLNNNKKVIAVPRKSRYNEHVNDHQIQIVSKFNEMGYIIGLNSVKELEDAILKIDDFKPKKYQSNNKHIVNFIDEYINNK